MNIDRELLNHPRDHQNAFRHTSSSLEDCLTIISECGGVDEAKEYMNEDQSRYIDKVLELSKHLNWYNQFEE